MTYAFLAKYDAHQMGKNLTALLEFYGCYFNASMTGIQENFFFNFTDMQQDPMVIIDPLNLSNNTSRTAFRIREIQDVFKSAHKIILNKLTSYKASFNSDESSED